MIRLWLTCLFALMWALFLFGVFKVRPAWMDIITGCAIITVIIMAIWLFWFREKLRGTVEEFVDNTVDMVDCTDSWVDYFESKDYTQSAYILLECVTEHLEDNTATYKDYLNYNK